MIESCTLVIFGSTGNLAKIKLLPALYHLERGGHLSPSMRVVGFGRRDWSDEHWRGEIREALADHLGERLDTALLERLLARCHFIEGDLEDDAGFRRLADRLRGSEDFPPNLVFYLAIAPNFYGVTVDRLAEQGLNAEEHGWSRLVVEKPFGYDLESAEILDGHLQRHFGERGIHVRGHGRCVEQRQLQPRLIEHDFLHVGKQLLADEALLSRARLSGDSFQHVRTPGLSAVHRRLSAGGPGRQGKIN